jgi:hypothetical protein
MSVSRFSPLSVTCGRVRRRQDDDRAARPSHPPMPHSRNRKRQLPFQEQLGESRQTCKGETSKLDERLTPKPSSSRIGSRWKSRVKSSRKSTSAALIVIATDIRSALVGRGVLQHNSQIQIVLRLAKRVMSAVRVRNESARSSRSSRRSTGPNPPTAQLRETGAGQLQPAPDCGGRVPPCQKRQVGPDFPRNTAANVHRRRMQL